FELKYPNRLFKNGCMKKFIFIIEILVWLSVLFSVCFGIGYYVEQTQKQHVTMSIDFDDIDGLDIGAPVNFMGVFVGSVEKFHMINDKVEVTFVIDNKNLKFPDGSTATVQFTGLVGAKTLEIEPPKKKTDSKQLIIPKNPIRISSYIVMSVKSLESLKDGCITIKNMLGDGAVANTKESIIDIGIASCEAIYYADQTYDVFYNARVIIISSLKKINKSLDNDLGTTDRIINSMQAKSYSEDTKAILRALKYTMFYFYQNLKESNYKRYLEDFIYAGNAVNRRIDQNSMKFFKGLKFDNIIKTIDATNQRILKFEGIFDKLYSKLENPYIKAKIVRILKTTGIIKDKTQALEKSI
ncbi:MAG: MlaD family protein, partial [Vampirovibrionia bacterium]